MIYQYNSFKKEIRFDFIDRNSGKLKLPLFGVFTALLALAVHFILQTMTRTILIDAVPEFMRLTYFSLIFTYNFLYLIVLLSYYATHYRDRTFAEIQKNQWHLQTKMGYTPTVLVVNKMLARLLTLVCGYSLGYLTILIIGLFLKYTFIGSYILTLYLVGLGDGVAVVVLVLTLSLVMRNNRYNSIMVLLVGFGYFLLILFSGRYSQVSDPLFMRQIARVFSWTESANILIIYLITFSCMLYALFRGRYAAFFVHAGVNMEHTTAIDEAPDSTVYKHVGMLDSKKAKRRSRHYKNESKWFGKLRAKRVLAEVEINDQPYAVLRIPNPEERTERVAKLINSALMSVAALLILMMLAFNVFVLLLSAAQGGSEVSIRGTIPYIFHSDTMEPSIYRNDLAYFQLIDLQGGLEVGDIVLFTDDYEIFIQRITEVDGDQLTVDIDNYPELAQEDAMLKTIERSQVYGLFYQRNRWLGALIHFANTIIGRILFLLIPSILLFYHDKIFKLIIRLFSHTVDSDQIEGQRALHEKRQQERIDAEKH